jgi:hypothetical protein
LSDINFTYTVISVDEAARCMEIVYVADGHQTMHIGARLPYEGENLEDVVMLFAPIWYWEEQKRTVIAPSIGASGVVNVPAVIASQLKEPVAHPITTGTQTL